MTVPPPKLQRLPWHSRRLAPISVVQVYVYVRLLVYLLVSIGLNNMDIDVEGFDRRRLDINSIVCLPVSMLFQYFLNEELPFSSVFHSSYPL